MADAQIRRRDRLWEKDKRCRRCGIETLLPKNVARMSGFFLPVDTMLNG